MSINKNELTSIGALKLLDSIPPIKVESDEDSLESET
jgi:hypothetical protein